MASFGYEDVGWFDIAMDDAFRVRRIQRIGDIDGNGKQCSGSSGLPAMRCFKGLPFQKLHGDKGASVLFADIVNRADVGMVQRRGGLGLPLENGLGPEGPGPRHQAET